MFHHIIYVVVLVADLNYLGLYVVPNIGCMFLLGWIALILHRIFVARDVNGSKPNIV